MNILNNNLDLYCIVDGVWGEWGDWSSCPVTCGGNSVIIRHRSCDSPAPANGGQECPGSANETQPCGAQSCPSEFIITSTLFVKKYL